MMPKAKFRGRAPEPRTEDLRITRMAVVLGRDGGWLRLDSTEVRDSLLYVGIERDVTLSLLSRHNARNPFGIAAILDYLECSGKLAEFLTQMLRLGYFPDNPDAFHNHLQPLGMDWNEAEKRVEPTTTRPEAEKELRTALEASLAQIGEDFPAMLNGAWEAYYSDNPDRYRHVVSSCRELLNQVTKELIGGEALDRKERVRRILGSRHKTELVESAADLVDAIYSAQSAEEHTSPDQSMALFVLVETEHILYFLLEQSKRKSS